MEITDFLTMDTTVEITAYAHGNNIAFCCIECGHAVLATALDNQRGSDVDHPAKCKGCNVRYQLDVQPQAAKLHTHFVTDGAA